MVGANRPLLLVDLRVVVVDDGLIKVRFEGINGSPVVCGICLRKAPQVSGNDALFSCAWFCLRFLIGDLKVFSFLTHCLHSCTVVRTSQDCIKCQNCATEIEISPARVLFD